MSDIKQSKTLRYIFMSLNFLKLFRTSLLLLFLSSLCAFAQNEKWHIASTVDEHNDAIEYLTYSPTGELLATGSKDNVIIIWDANTGEVVQKLIGHKSMINHLAFTKDGSVIASASSDGTVKLWNARTGALLKTFANAPQNSNYKATNFVVFDDKEEFIYYGGKNHRINKASLYEAGPPEEIYAGLYMVTCGVLSPDGTHLIFGAGKHVLFMHLETYKITHQVRDNADFVNDIQFAPDFKTIWWWTEDGTLYSWDYDNQLMLGSIKAGDKGYSHIAFSPDGKHMVTGNSGKNILVWDVAEKRVDYTAPGHEEKVRTFAFSNNGAFASGGYDGVVNFWRRGPKAVPPPPKPVEPEPPVVKEVVVNDRKVITKSTANMENENIVIEVWDDKYVDGDVISLYYNDQLILGKYSLKKRKKILKIKAAENSENLLVLYAHNTGERPPNTATIILSDGKITRKYTLSSDLDESGGILIKRK